MWKCGGCGEQVEEDFEVCWNCQRERGEAAAVRASSGSSAEPASADSSTHRPIRTMGEQLEKRYRDAYRVARVTIFFGSLSKVLAGLVAGVALLLAMSASNQLSGGLAILGVFAGLILYVAGVLIAAQGQLLLTSVDEVINTSPFLTDSERANIMRVALEDAE